MVEIQNISEKIWKKSIKMLNSKIGSKSQKHDQLNMPIFLQPNEEEIPNETANSIAKTKSHMI